MLVNEEIKRVRELMSLLPLTESILINEAPPKLPIDDVAKKFAKELLELFGKQQKNLTDEELSVLFKRNRQEMTEFLRKLRQYDTPEAFEQFFKNLSVDDFAKFLDNIDLRAMATATYNGHWGKTLRRGFERAIKEKGWLNLEGDALEEEYEILAGKWYDLIVNKGMGKFVDTPMPPQFKEYYEFFYEILMVDFRNSVEKLRPGFTDRIAAEVVPTYRTRATSKSWGDIVPLTKRELAQLEAKNKGFTKSYYQLQDKIKNFFRSRAAIQEEYITELQQLIKTFGGDVNTSLRAQTDYLKASKDRISYLMEQLQKMDKAFYDDLDNWVNLNWKGLIPKKSELQNLPGYIKAKQLSDGTTAKEIDELYGTYRERSARLRTQWYDFIFKWKESWKKKYGDEVGKWSKITKSDEFKELRKSYLLGSTLSPADWYRISKKLGIPATIAKLGKEVALTWIALSAIKAIWETLKAAVISGIYTAFPNDYWRSLAYDEEGNYIFGEDPNGVGFLGEQNRWLIIPIELGENFAKELISWNQIIPGLGDDTYVEVQDLILSLRSAFGFTPEKQQEIIDNTNKVSDNIEGKFQEVTGGGETEQSEPTQPERLLIPNDLETLFPQELIKNIKRDGTLTVGKFKYILNDGTDTYEYLIQKKTFDGTQKWAIELPEGSDNWYPLDNQNTMASIIAASK